SRGTAPRRRSGPRRYRFWHPRARAPAQPSVADALHHDAITSPAMAIRNWNDSARCEPAQVVSPATTDELRRVVTDRDTYPSPVRAAGSLHSLNPSFTTHGTLVFTHRFKHIGAPAHGTIAVGAGVTMLELRDALRRHGLQIEVTPEIGNATAGSVACCGTKDSSLGPTGLGQVSSTVTAVRLVDANGELREVSRESDPERLRLVRSSYGLLGI